MEKNRKLILEDGSVYEGYGFGDDSERVLELVFNTSMVGYQEIISDPSYTDQAVVMTYPLIGNYGINEEDYESQNPTIGGLVVREYNDDPSNFRSSHTLNEVMIKYEIVGIYGVDTRQITRKLRDKGSMKAMITDIEVNNDEDFAKSVTNIIVSIPKLKEMAKQAKIIGNRNYSKERFIEIVKTEVISKFPQKRNI